ncbi:MAG: hypothetical protein ACSHWT_13835, partial [Glaciecola sp.]
GLVFPRGIYRGLIAVLDKRAFLTRKFRFTTINGVVYAKLEPFDSHRMTRFHSLADYLQRCELMPSSYSYNTQRWRHLSFYESYFSNYIKS